MSSDVETIRNKFLISDNSSQLDAASAPVGKDLSAASPEEYIVLLADRWLLEMPLEALALISSPDFSSVSRDFSLQMIYHRIHREPEGNLFVHNSFCKPFERLRSVY